MKNIVINLPIRVFSEANSRDHWMVKHKRKKAQQFAVLVAWRNKKESVKLPCKIIFTRFGKQPMDSDNLAGAFKGVRDQMAREIGVDDGSPLIEFEYRQIQTVKNEHRISIEVEEVAPTLKSEFWRD